MGIAMLSLSHKCPRCGSDNVSRSKRQGMIEKVISVVRLLPYRCNNYSCGSRFFIIFPRK
ncbi:hypothetical protein Cri9333_2829 [Crinalium epipsammum PCC 9333]|uniref:Zinc finger Ogr/Delta-type domain-containing protein n=1 Tax=Crinalium epipsammum PCC 9333 TaxID=1173022 RepID=K9VZW7_9CYAN|nr:hypothetical protein Cri9333_2829 [Crinalium epipsammum PCC 9333]